MAAVPEVARCGETREAAIVAAEVAVLRHLADRLEAGDPPRFPPLHRWFRPDKDPDAQAAEIEALEATVGQDQFDPDEFADWPGRPDNAEAAR